MADFQILRGSYLAINGITESQDEIETLDDLDDLYSAAAQWMKKEE